mmetsp:Transcript_6678/g.14439  ORF Transcript_6678/g.14439 Transcript_6678/m.14439 type:complete len:309 (+) Transcript_6678:1094-2020(+)
MKQCDLVVEPTNGLFVGFPFRLPPQSDLSRHRLPSMVFHRHSSHQQHHRRDDQTDAGPLPSFLQRALRSQLLETQFLHVGGHDIHFRFVFFEYFGQGGVFGMDEFANLFFVESGEESVFGGHHGFGFGFGRGANLRDGAFFVGAVGGEGISGFAIVFVVVVVVAGGRFSCCLIDDATGALAVDDVPVQMVLRPEQPQQSHGAFPRPGAQGLQRLGMGRYPQRVAHLGHRLGRVGPSPLLLRLVGIGNGKEGLHPPDHDFVRLDEFRELKALDDRRGVPFFFSVSFLQPRQSFGPMPLLHLHQGRQKHD